MTFWQLHDIMSAIFALALVIFIASKLMHKSFVSHISECFLWWITFSFVLPFRAKKLGLITKYLYGWMLTLTSPPALLIYYIVYSLSTINDPLPYNRLQFTSHDDIAAITKIPNFPEFEYQTNIHNGLDCTTTIKYVFKDKEQVDQLFRYLDSEVSSEDNIYWKKDTVNSHDISFYGVGAIYNFKRGWDSLYVKRPKDIDCNDTQVRIVIGRKGFTVSSDICWTGSLDKYAVPDSLETLTGVKFPPFEFVNKSFTDNFQDYSCDVTIRMAHKPSDEMIRAMEKGDNWTELTDGTYSFRLDNQKSFVEFVNINPNSRIATITYETY